MPLELDVHRHCLRLPSCLSNTGNAGLGTERAANKRSCNMRKGQSMKCITCRSSGTPFRPYLRTGASGVTVSSNAESSSMSAFPILGENAETDNAADLRVAAGTAGVANGDAGAGKSELFDASLVPSESTASAAATTSLA